MFNMFKDFTVEKYDKLIKISAWHDIILTAPFTFPFITQFSLGVLTSIHDLLNLPGYFPPFYGLHILFVNLMVVFIFLWAVVRLRHAEPFFGLYDAIGRSLFMMWMLYHLFFSNATGILWFFIASEFVWAKVNFYGFYKIQKLETRVDLG